MAMAIDVALYLIKLAELEGATNEPECISNLRLQKLLYYVQGWSLAQRGKPMFSEQIEAWAHGPAVPGVYRAFKRYGYQSIPFEKVGEPKNLTKAERDLVEGVWNVYKAYSAISLREMTHREPPWKVARGDCGPADASETVITHASMKRYFSKLARSS